MKLQASEISEILKSKIEKFGIQSEVRTEGTIISVRDGIVRIFGLSHVMYEEMIEFSNNTYALAFNLERDSVSAVLLGNSKNLKEGMKAYCTGRILEVPVGESLLGRVIDPLGNPIDGRGPLEAKETSPIERIAPGVIDRQSVDQPLQTGLKAIDAMTPIGRGQRQLIIGDRQTGKTAIAIDTIINQKDTDVFCIYVAIGQKASSVSEVVNKLNFF